MGAAGLCAASVWCGCVTRIVRKTTFLGVTCVPERVYCLKTDSENFICLKFFVNNTVCCCDLAGRGCCAGGQAAGVGAVSGRGSPAGMQERKASRAGSSPKRIPPRVFPPASRLLVSVRYAPSVFVPAISAAVERPSGLPAVLASSASFRPAGSLTTAPIMTPRWHMARASHQTL